MSFFTSWLVEAVGVDKEIPLLKITYLFLFQDEVPTLCKMPSQVSKILMECFQRRARASTIGFCTDANFRFQLFLQFVDYGQKYCFIVDCFGDLFQSGEERFALSHDLLYIIAYPDVRKCQI